MYRLNNHLLTPQELMDMYDQVEQGGCVVMSSRCNNFTDDGSNFEDGSSSGGSGGDGKDEEKDLMTVEKLDRQKPMRRYIAITIVEVLFVLAESSFWQVDWHSIVP